MLFLNLVFAFNYLLLLDFIAFKSVRGLKVVFIFFIDGFFTPDFYFIRIAFLVRL